MTHTRPQPSAKRLHDFAAREPRVDEKHGSKVAPVPHASTDRLIEGSEGLLAVPLISVQSYDVTVEAAARIFRKILH